MRKYYRGFSSNRTFKWTSHMMMEQQRMRLAEPWRFRFHKLGNHVLPHLLHPAPRPSQLRPYPLPSACRPFAGGPEAAPSQRLQHTAKHITAQVAPSSFVVAVLTYHAWCHNNLRALLQQWPMMMFPFHRDRRHSLACIRAGSTISHNSRRNGHVQGKMHPGVRVCCNRPAT